MNRITVASVAGLMVLASTAQALASMSLSSPQPVEPGCPTTGSAAGTTNGKDNIDGTAGIPGRASVATTILPAAATAAIPSSATIAAVPSDTTTVTIPSGATTATAPSGASSATTTGTSRATNATGSSDRRRTEQVERWDELNQRIGELARRKAPQLAEESTGSRKRGLERIERFLDIAHKMKPGVLARYR
jgi:hypothetical protein